MKLIYLTGFCCLFTSCLFEKLPQERSEAIEIYSYDIEEVGTDVEFLEDLTGFEGVAAKKAPKEESFSFVGQVTAPEVNGKAVQANVVEFKGNLAAVGYNSAGDDFAGALQVFKFKDKKLEKKLTEVTLNNLDIQALWVEGSELYFAGHSNPEVYGATSFAGVAKIDKLSSQDISASLKFYNVGSGITSFVIEGTDVYAAVGGVGGGLLKLNSDLDSLSYEADEDLRQILTEQGVLYSLSGNLDGVAQVFNYDTQTSIYDFSSSTQEETRNDFVFSEGYFYVARANAGMSVIDTEGNLIYEIANPNSNLETHANGVTREGSFLFLANGEYGFRYIDLDSDENYTVKGYEPYSGKVDETNQNYSANSLRFRSDYLVVAAGVGGAMVYKLTD